MYFSTLQIIAAIYLFVGIIVGIMKSGPKMKKDIVFVEKPRAHPESVLYKSEWRKYESKVKRLRSDGYEGESYWFGQYYWTRTYTERKHPLFCFVIVPLFWVFLIWGE
jgi:hypothetical protein